MQREIILASNSPRRSEILRLAGFQFNIIPSTFDEKTIKETDPKKYCMELAKNKAKLIFNAHPDSIVIGADTIVVLNKEIIGKPLDRKNAFEIISKLNNKTHHVYTGYAIICKEKEVIDYDESKVTFNNLLEEEILEYLDLNLYAGKAGAYGIQDKTKIIKEYTGSFYNIMGLPIEKIKEEIKLYEK